MKRALITGITGQDGFFLAELLLAKGYCVYGFSRIDRYLNNNVQRLVGDISSESDIKAAIASTQPDEIYHLASQSRPGMSWDSPAETLIANGLGAIRLFDAVRTISPTSRVCHASSSELFGHALHSPQNEDTPFASVTPYAASKLYAHQMARTYREHHDLFVSNAILFNHESERRPLHFVTQKIAYGAACAALGILTSPDNNERGLPIVLDGKLALGNLGIARDWGYAPDYVRAMWLMLQQDKADDFVIGTGQLHTLKELCEVAYYHAGYDWRDHVTTDMALIRPDEPGQLVADASKAHTILHWKPSVDFQTMIRRMVDAQVAELSRQLR